MYLKSITLEHIRCFEDLRLELPDGGQEGFHVILADNGAGKTTLLQAIAISLLGPRGIEPWVNGWVREGFGFGRIAAEVALSPADQTRGRRRIKRPYRLPLLINARLPDLRAGRGYQREPSVNWEPTISDADTAAAEAGPYSGLAGWFTCGYGPFRRLTGMDRPEFEEAARGGRRAGFLTLFSEGAAVINCEGWLRELYSTSNDNKLAEPERERASQQLDGVRAVIDSLLPGSLRLHDVNSREVTFTTEAGVNVGLHALSDGFRSFLALVIDLLRQLAVSPLGLTVDHSGEVPVVDAEGVVLIDEADAHLHPEWQRKLGFELVRVFPKLQFVVTTHSPLVAMAARPDGLFRLRRKPDGAVELLKPEASVQGWQVQQVLLSALFGLPSTRDPDTEAKLAERLALRAQAQLSPDETRRLAELDAVLAERLTEPGDTVEEQDERRAMRAFVQATLASLGQQA